MLDRCEHVVIAARDHRRDAGQHGQARALVVHLQRVQELDQCGDGRVVNHVLGEGNDARAHGFVTEGRGPQDRPQHRAGRAAGAVHHLGGVARGEPHRLQRGVLQDLTER